MSARLRFLKEAQKEIQDAFSWYESKRTGLGDEFAGELSSLFQRISHSPQSFPSGPHETRKAVLKRFPFVVYFVAGKDWITIVAVYHSSRIPGGWADRFGE